MLAQQEEFLGRRGSCDGRAREREKKAFVASTQTSKRLLDKPV